MDFYINKNTYSFEFVNSDCNRNDLHVKLLTDKFTIKGWTKLWKTHSFSFVIVILFAGIFLGAVLGSLLSQIFGLDFLNYGLFQVGFADFYIMKSIEIIPTPASLIGLMIAIWVLYKKGASLHQM